MDNDFYGIHLSQKSRHASDAKRELYKELDKQIDYKVYQVIGIPIEILNNTIPKPTTRYENYKFARYLKNLNQEWLDVNGKYLTDKEKASITNMYFESREDFEYRSELAKEGKAPSWYVFHKYDNLLQFCKGLYKIIVTSYNTRLNPTNFHGFNLVDIYNNVKMFVCDILNQVFDNTIIPVNNDLQDTESKSQKDGFDHARDKRNGKNEQDEQDNNELTRFRNIHRTLFENSDGDYSRRDIIIYASKQLLQRQLSISYIVETGYSCYIGFIGNKISYIDKEIDIFFKNPLTYSFKKGTEYVNSLTQSYITRVVTDQSITAISLLSITESLSDDCLIKYINPGIGCVVGFTVSCINYLSQLDTSKEQCKFKYVVLNSSISAVNTSFGMIYNYLDEINFLGDALKTTKWTKLINWTTLLINKVFKLALTVNFVGGVIGAALFNIGIRFGSYIYTLYKEHSMYSKYICMDHIPEYEKNVFIPEYESNPILPEHTKHILIPEYDKKKIIPEYENTPFIPDCDNITNMELIKQIESLNSFNESKTTKTLLVSSNKSLSRVNKSFSRVNKSFSKVNKSFSRVNKRF